MLITIIDSDTNTNRPTTPKPAAGSQSSTAKSSFSTSSASGDITASSSSTGNTELIGILHAFIFVSKQIMGSCFSSFTFKGFKGPVHSPTQAFNENGAQTSLSSGIVKDYLSTRYKMKLTNIGCHIFACNVTHRIMT